MITYVLNLFVDIIFHVAVKIWFSKNEARRSRYSYMNLLPSIQALNK